MYLQTIYITKQSTRRIYKQTDVYLITIEIERGRDKRVQMVHLKNPRQSMFHLWSSFQIKSQAIAAEKGSGVTEVDDDDEEEESGLMNSFYLPVENV